LQFLTGIGDSHDQPASAILFDGGGEKHIVTDRKKKSQRLSIGQGSTSMFVSLHRR
jgi:hypothetical protein